MLIKEVSFQEIEAYWKANIYSAMATVPMRAALDQSGAQDPNIAAYEAKFWAAYDTANNNQLVATISGHMTSATEYRIRGLDVTKGPNTMGLFRALLATAEQEGRTWGCTTAWTASREGHTNIYENNGYTIVGDWGTHKAGDGTQMKLLTKPLA